MDATATQQAAPYERIQTDSRNGWTESDVVELAPHPPDKGKQSNPNFTANGRFAPGNQLQRGKSVAAKRNLRAQFVLKCVRRSEWRRIVKTMVAIATDEKNRQAVAAATWISDRIAGPIAQQHLIESVNVDLSPEDKRICLQTRLAELGLLPQQTTPEAIEVQATQEVTPPIQSEPTPDSVP